MAFVLPSLPELNALSASECSLLVLRALCTSDLTFFHSLLKPETCADIALVCLDLVEAEKTEFGLSEADLVEARELAALIRE